MRQPRGFAVISTAQPKRAYRTGALSSIRDRRLRLARRLTFLVCPRKVSKRRAPGIRPCTPLRYAAGSFAPSALQVHAAKGRPRPIAALATSMSLNPFHTDSAHPSDGVVGPCSSSNVEFRTQRFGSQTIPVRRPSPGTVQRGIWHGCQMRNDGPWMALRDDPRNSAGVRAVERSETRMPGGVSFAYFSLHKQRKVRRPAGRNLQPDTQQSPVGAHI